MTYPFVSAGRFSLLLPAALFTLIFLSSAQESGCKRKGGGITAAKPASSVRSPEYLQKQMRRRNMGDVRNMTARADIFAEGNGDNITANAQIIWVRDSVLFVNVKKFGLEAIRAMIRPDSAFILNRLDKTYIAEDLESLQRRFSLPEGFPLLQEVLLASAYFLPDLKLKSDIREDLHRLSGANGQYSSEYRIEEGSYFLRYETFIRQKDASLISLSFDSYKKTEEAGAFPYLRRIEAFSPETGAMRLQIKFDHVAFNVQPKFRFEIPDHYKRVEND
jgi:hypothetical protein